MKFASPSSDLNGAAIFVKEKSGEHFECAAGVLAGRSDLGECPTAKAGRHHQHWHALVFVAVCRHAHLHVLDGRRGAVAVLLIDDVQLVIQSRP